VPTTTSRLQPGPVSWPVSEVADLFATASAASTRAAAAIAACIPPHRRRARRDLVIHLMMITLVVIIRPQLKKISHFLATAVLTRHVPGGRLVVMLPSTTARHLCSGMHKERVILVLSASARRLDCARHNADREHDFPRQLGRRWGYGIVGTRSQRKELPTASNNITTQSRFPRFHRCYFTDATRTGPGPCALTAVPEQRTISDANHGTSQLEAAYSRRLIRHRAKSRTKHKKPNKLELVPARTGDRDCANTSLQHRSACASLSRVATTWQTSLNVTAKACILSLTGIPYGNDLRWAFPSPLRRMLVSSRRTTQPELGPIWRHTQLSIL